MGPPKFFISLTMRDLRVRRRFGEDHFAIELASTACMVIMNLQIIIGQMWLQRALYTQQLLELANSPPEVAPVIRLFWLVGCYFLCWTILSNYLLYLACYFEFSRTVIRRYPSTPVRTTLCVMLLVLLIGFHFW